MIIITIDIEYISLHLIESLVGYYIVIAYKRLKGSQTGISFLLTLTFIKLHFSERLSAEVRERDHLLYRISDDKPDPGKLST